MIRKRFSQCASMYRAFFILGTIEVMRTLVTRVLWLAGIGVVLYGGFVAYERWWDGDLSLVKERVLSFVNEGAEVAKERAVEVGGEAFQTVKEEATETAKGVVASAVGGVIESIGEAIQSYGESVAGTSVPPGSSRATETPTPSGDGYQIPPPPVTLTARVGVTLTFSINEGESYVAAWGDGTMDEGQKSENASVLLRHAWDRAGDYTVTLTTVTGDVKRAETFPTRIYE